MGKVIPFDNVDVDKMADNLLAEIEQYLKKYFNEAINQNDGNTPIYQAKRDAIIEVSKKYNLTHEKTNEIVREIQLRNLDKDLGLK